MEVVYLALAVAFNVAAYVVFKTISHRTHDSIWFLLFAVGLILGAINVALFAATLKKVNLNIAYPVFAGASITCMVFVSALVFGESMKSVNLLGTALVIAGIVALTQ